MNGYKITYKETTYITNADSFEEAEEKFIEQYELQDDYTYSIDQDTAENLKTIENAIFF